MEKIKQIRLALGIRQCDLAEELGISNSNYNLIENGKRSHPRAVEIYEARAKKILNPKIDSAIRKTEQKAEQLRKLKLQLNEN